MLRAAAILPGVPYTGRVYGCHSWNVNIPQTDAGAVRFVTALVQLLGHSTKDTPQQ